MNIFRIVGDLSHLLAVIILLAKILRTRSCAGISGRSQILFALVYTTRYLDLFIYFISWYNSIMKVVFLGATYTTMCLIYTKFRATYDWTHDRFRIEFLVIATAILALLLNHEFAPLEVFWTFSIYLESVAILPQLFLVSKTGKTESIICYYLICLGSYRGLYIFNWIYRYYNEGFLDLIAMVAGVIQTMLYCYWYFVYLYITRGADKVETEQHHSVHVLGWIQMSPNNHQDKAKHVLATWCPRCSALLFTGTKGDPGLSSSFSLDVSAKGRDNLWEKTAAAFGHTYEHYRDQADSSYVIIGNSPNVPFTKDSNQLIYYGCRFPPAVKQVYMSSEAGCVLSREALERFVSEAMASHIICQNDQACVKDVEMGKCLEDVRMKPGSLDKGGSLPLNPEQHIISGHVPDDSWFRQPVYFPTQMSMNCSDSALPFHYVSPNTMFKVENLMYHLQRHRIQRAIEPLPLVHSSVGYDGDAASVPFKHTETRNDKEKKVLQSAFEPSATPNQE